MPEKALSGRPIGGPAYFRGRDGEGLMPTSLRMAGVLNYRSRRTIRLQERRDACAPPRP